MKTYHVGARVFCDFHFGGKPHGEVVKVLIPGSGQNTIGLVKVKLTQTVKAYKKGELLDVPAWQAVPLDCEFKKPESCFRYVSTTYEYV